MQAWAWWIVALVCLGLEVGLGASLVFVFWAVGAGAAGTLLYVGWIEAPLQQVCAFVGTAATSMLVLRRRLRRPASEATAARVVQPERATLDTDIGPGQIGSVQMRGTVWRARNDGPHTLRAGHAYPVVRIDNLTVVLSEVDAAASPM